MLSSNIRNRHWTEILAHGVGIVNLEKSCTDSNLCVCTTPNLKHFFFLIEAYIQHRLKNSQLRETYDILHGMGIYPDSELPGFSTAFSTMFEACNELAKKIVILFAISLNLDPKYFLNRCTHIDDMTLPRAVNMRALHYPPIPNDMDVQPGTVRLGKHSDYALLTFFFQDMIGGLEVWNK